jgi:hypothetical protein
MGIVGQSVGHPPADGDEFRDGQVFKVEFDFGHGGEV